MRFGRSRVLVTGAAGFVGSNLIARLLSSGADIRAAYHKKSPVIKDRGIDYVRADLRDTDACRKLVKGVDYVFMCAASTSGAAVITSDPIVHVTPNVVMNSRMLEASYLAGVKKFIWISSSVGYPPSGDRPVKENEFFEGDPYPTYFASGWMKRYTEILCRMYSDKLEHRMPSIVLRPSNIYGPRDKFDLERSHVTAALVRKVVERHKPLVVWGNGNDVRDIIYIDDFIEATLLAAEKINSYDPLNIAQGKAFTVREILNTILDVDGFGDAHVVYDRSKPSMIPIRLIDVRKAKKQLGFHARTTLREGLQKTVEWYRQSRRKLG